MTVPHSDPMGDEPRAAARFSPRRSLVAQVTLAAGLTLGVLIAALLSAGFYLGRQALRENIDAQLRSVASSRRDTVRAHLWQWQQLVALLAMNGEYRGLLQQLKTGQAATDNRLFSQSSLDGFVDAGTIRSALLADLAGRVQIASKGADPAGELAGDPVFQGGLTGPHIGQPRRVGDHFEVVLAAPVIDFNTPPSTIGVLLITLDVSPLAQALRDTTGLGQTGEVLLGVRDGGRIRFLFPPRYRDDVPSLPVAGAPAMAAATEGREHMARNRDYRGVPVLAAGRPIGYGGWSLVAKLDEAEAYGPIDRALRSAWLAGGIAAGVGLAAAFLLARRFTRPIRRLAQAAASVADGNFEASVPVRSSNEFGALCMAFNEMTAALRTRTSERAKAEASLAAERALLRTLIDVLPISIYVKDAGSRFLVANAESARALGAASPDKMLGRTDADYFPVAIAAACAEDEKRVLAGESIINIEEDNVRPDGTPRTELTTKVPLRDGTGAIVGIVGVSRDITERKQAEAELAASERRFRQLAESLPQLVWTCTAEGACDYLSPQWVAYTGVLAALQLGDGWLEQIHPEDRARVKDEWSSVVPHGVQFDSEFRIRRHDGVYRWFSTRAAPVRDKDGRVLKWFGAHTDIDGAKLAEEEVLRLNASLEQRVAERTEQLEEANRELESFSYSVSHDLRAPLRAVNGYARMVLDTYGERLDDEGRRLTGVICREALRMGQLIDALLEFSRIGRQAVSVTPIDMTALAREAFAEAALEMKERKVDFRLGDLPSVRGDRTLLRQVFVNLFSNALKFTRQRELAVIEVGARKEDGETAYWVRDNGAGFDPRYADQLFGLFQRLHRQEEFEGTGVGLAFVQRIVHRHGGRIWADSKPGEGATFQFTLPPPEA